MNGVPWDQISVGVAAVLGLIYVARTLRRTMRDVLQFLENHLSHLARTQADVASALQRVVDRLEELGRDITQRADR